MNITIVAGARPNFMKIAPIIRAIEMKKEKHQLQYQLVHTGQHFDKNMSEQFFEQLEIPAPHANLAAGGGSQAEQTAAIMIGFENYLLKHPCNLVLVVGDVTSTLACSIVAKKMKIPVAHVEAGIRSGDMTMPEEINRIVTDSITDYFFTTSEYADHNLQRNGVPVERIYFVGNTMIDTLLHSLSRLKQPAWWNQKQQQINDYLVLTLHRPCNVDNQEHLLSLLHEIVKQSKGMPIIFPVHPRTMKTLEQSGYAAPNLHITAPLGYLEFIWLVRHAKAVITDSGGITEETTVLGVPCMTLRDSTERPETVIQGTNELLGTDPANIEPAMERLRSGAWKRGQVPPLWDGHAAERIVEILLKIV